MNPCEGVPLPLVSLQQGLALGDGRGEVQGGTLGDAHDREGLLLGDLREAHQGKALENTDLSFLGPKGSGVLTISGGLATFPRDADSPEKLFRRADNALLDAKRSGKNRIYLVGTQQNDIEDIH